MTSRDDKNLLLIDPSIVDGSMINLYVTKIKSLCTDFQKFIYRNRNRFARNFIMLIIMNMIENDWFLFTLNIPFPIKREDACSEWTSCNKPKEMHGQIMEILLRTRIT
ncbi:hypothetical protein AM231_10015 [Paenibacillus solani]|uniref:Uncharacterized protein n=1 Tax=Paenibacillus solani TaxID=1705565 RepID=A0A0M1P571_9BACL|nr:hypothetical protein AM231_10015 [Paenibacillus solani]